MWFTYVVEEAAGSRNHVFAADRQSSIPATGPLANITHIPRSRYGSRNVAMIVATGSD